MKRLKSHLREHLLKLSKEELVDIISDLCSGYVFSSVASGLIHSNRIQECINNVQTNLQQVDDNCIQKINDNFIKI